MVSTAAPTAAGMALQVAGAVADRDVHGYGPAAPRDLLRHGEVLRSGVEVERDGRRVCDGALGLRIRLELMANGMRLFRARQRRKIPVAKFFRRNCEEFDRVF